jgi:hypothetical protein
MFIDDVLSQKSTSPKSNLSRNRSGSAGSTKGGVVDYDSLGLHADYQLGHIDDQASLLS